MAVIKPKRKDVFIWVCTSYERPETEWYPLSRDVYNYLDEEPVDLPVHKCRAFDNMEFDTETKQLSFDWSFSYGLKGRATVYAVPLEKMEGHEGWERAWDPNISAEKNLQFYGSTGPGQRVETIKPTGVGNERALYYQWRDKGGYRALAYIPERETENEGEIRMDKCEG